MVPLDTENYLLLFELCYFNAGLFRTLYSHNLHFLSSLTYRFRKIFTAITTATSKPITVITL